MKAKSNDLHPGRLTWNLKMMVWKIIFLSKWVICRFHVNLPGCHPWENRRTYKYVSYKKCQTLIILLMERIRRTSWYGKYPNIYQGFSTIPGGCLGILPSTVCQPVMCRISPSRITMLLGQRFSPCLQEFPNDRGPGAQTISDIHKGNWGLPLGCYPLIINSI